MKQNPQIVAIEGARLARIWRLTVWASEDARRPDRAVRQVETYGATFAEALAEAEEKLEKKEIRID